MKNNSYIYHSGKASMGEGGQRGSPDSKKLAKKSGKRGGNWGKQVKKSGKRGKIAKKRQKPERFFHFARDR